MNAWQWPSWNLDVCLRVCPPRLRISCMSMCVCVPERLVYVSLSDLYMCASLAFLDRGTLSASAESFQRPATTHTQTHITHPTADTCMSPRQPDTAKDMQLTEKRRPPYWQARGSHHGGLRTAAGITCWIRTCEFSNNVLGLQRIKHLIGNLSDWFRALISYTAGLVLTYAEQVRSTPAAFHTCGSYCWSDLVQRAQALKAVIFEVVRGKIEMWWWWWW